MMLDENNAEEKEPQLATIFEHLLRIDPKRKHYYLDVQRALRLPVETCTD